VIENRPDNFQPKEEPMPLETEPWPIFAEMVLSALEASWADTARRMAEAKAAEVQKEHAHAR
jgi:hypothetical protein